jgi:guanylate kinase
MKQGKIFFISGPSGVGKGTLIAGLKKKHPDWAFPPSCTTREPRPGEIDGETYFYISKEEFKQRIAKNEFLEWAEVHGGNFYGTMKKPILDAVNRSQIVIREFDIQGFLTAREKLPKELFTSIFIVTDRTVEQLIERIRDRAPITKEEIAKRKESMTREMATAKFYDFKLLSIDKEINQMIEDAEEIIRKNS